MNLFWIGGSGNWSDLNHWSLTSGGAVGGTVPTATDDVFVNNSSAAGAMTITFDVASPPMKSLIVAGNTFQVSFAKVSGISFITPLIYSHLTLNNTFHDPAVTFAMIGVGTLTQTGTSGGTLEIRVGAGTMFSGTVTLATTLNLSYLLISLGSFNAAGNTINVNQYLMSTVGTSVTSANFTNSTINVASSWNIYNPSLVTLTMTNSTINLQGGTSTFGGGGKSYNILNIGVLFTANISGSNTFATFTASAPGRTIAFAAGSTQTITGTGTFTGASSSNLRLRSSAAGSTYTLTKATGTIAGQYLDIQDSIATGGATWNANLSTNSGNNTGWNFIGPQPPAAGFTYTPSSIYRSQSVTFTDTSTNTPTSWLWNFGDSTTSTAQNPVHQYNVDGTFTVSLTATNGVGSDTETKTDIITVALRTYTLSFTSNALENGDSNLVSETSTISFAAFEQSLGKVVVLTDYQALSQKDYEYRVYDHNDNFIGIWEEPTSEFSYDQSINQNASELNVHLSRSPNNVSVSYDTLLDHLGDPILDNNSSPILVSTETANAVGPGTDVEYNYNVQVVAYYGGFEALLDEFSDPILDNMGEQILVPYGYPNGKVVYSGYIGDYTLEYGERAGVDIVVVPHATEYNDHIFKNGTNTFISYGSATDPVQMARDVMDKYIAEGGRIRYTNESMPYSGESAPYDFNLQRTRLAIDKTIELLPTGYYQFADPGENIQYLLQKGSTADHTFYYEQHISNLKLRKSITQLVNEVYFVGGNIAPPNTTEENLFNYYSDPASIAAIRPGVEILSDSRVTDPLSAQILSQNKINDFKDPRYRTSVTISDGVYDIESIKLGQMVGFKNFGSFADNLVLQIVTLHRRKHSVTLDLDMNIPGEAKRLEEIKKALLSQDVSNIPIAPS